MTTGSQVDECCACWTPFVVVRTAPGTSQMLGMTNITYDVPCPYCGCRNEFAYRVEIEPVEMPEAERRLLVATKRLGWEGATLASRVGFYRRRLSLLRSSLEHNHALDMIEQQLPWWPGVWAALRRAIRRRLRVSET
jgi:hypothetical protein